MLHWGMVAVSLAGLILSLMHVAECAMVQTGYLDREIPTTIIFEIDEKEPADPFTIWFNNLEASMQQFQKDYLIHDTNFNPDKSLTISVPSPLGGKTNNLELPGRISESGVELGEGMRLADTVSNSSYAIINALKAHLLQQTSNNTLSNAVYTAGGLSATSHDYSADNNLLLLTHGSRVKRSDSSDGYRRVRRQTVLDVPIPISPAFYPGRDDARSDECGRNQVKMKEHEDEQTTEDEDSDDDDDYDCYDVLTRGPCKETEYVLVDPVTREGFCGPRLCSPDRVFLYTDQQCHDPHEEGLCPDGRQLFTSGFGTPLCGCEDGYYEMEDRPDHDDDDDDDTCQQLLTEIPQCPPGKVFWFSSFRSPPTCLPDPCKGLNLNRRYSQLPYVPALKNSKCYQIGSRPNICRSDQLYSLDLSKLKGVCRSLEEAGFLELDSSTLSTFKDMFGSPLSKESATRPLKFKKNKSHKSNWKTKSYTPAIGSSVVPSTGGVSSPFMIGQSVVKPKTGLTKRLHWPKWALQPTHASAHSMPLIAIGSNYTSNLFGSSVVKVSSRDGSWSPLHRQRRSLLSRRKRAPLAHAAPSNVFEPALASCKAGAARDINQKCRATLLPSRTPNSRPRRAVRPVRPAPVCPRDGVRGLQRRCTSSRASVQTSIIALGLG